jgi:hypothetical protein
MGKPELLEGSSGLAEGRHLPTLPLLPSLAPSRIAAAAGTGFAGTHPHRVKGEEGYSPGTAIHEGQKAGMGPRSGLCIGGATPLVHPHRAPDGSSRPPSGETPRGMDGWLPSPSHYVDGAIGFTSPKRATMGRAGSMGPNGGKAFRRGSAIPDG